jgi:S-adenosylmethionine:tRNA ribosyltransferase-isomerase
MVFNSDVSIHNHAIEHTNFTCYFASDKMESHCGRNVKAMLLKQDYHYNLPEHLIAQQPLSERSASKLLCLNRATGAVTDTVFSQITELLTAGDLLVLNNTRVIPARLFGHKITGGKVEILIERVLSDTLMLVQIRASKALKTDQEVIIANQFRVAVTERKNALYTLQMVNNDTIDQMLSSAGHMPLPPYIKRSDTLEDQTRYQSVFAEQPGAAAAPTASLHFDQLLLDKIHNQGIETGFITLHVGAGTFQPIRVNKLADHVMHSERVDVSADIVEKICQTKMRKGRIIAVGTTVMRALEAASLRGTISPLHGETQLFITPGFRFNTVDAMLTNFHVSESTLLTLVCAFGGYQQVMKAYQHAITQSYRFFSYGDAMFISN